MVNFLNKTGQLIMLSLLWIAGCLPVVTIAASNAALYYAVIKTVRGGEGQPVSEFWTAYKRSLQAGSLSTVFAAAVGMAAVFLIALMGFGVGGVIAILISFWFAFIGPVISRVGIPLTKLWKLTLAISFREAHVSVLLCAGAVILVLLQLFVLPFPTMLLLPGAWCWLITFPVEKAFRKYMPDREDDEDPWYFEP